MMSKQGKASRKNKAVRHSLKWPTMAAMLCDALQSADGLRCQRHLPKWEEQFKLLHEEDGAPSAMLWDILKWYCSKMKAKKLSKLPKCFSANMFRGAFGWIKGEWEKEKETAQKKEKKESNLSCVEYQRWLDAARSTFRRWEFNRTVLTIEALAELYQEIGEWWVLTKRNIESTEGLDQGTGQSLFWMLHTGSEGITLPEQVGDYLYHRIEGWEDWSGSLESYRPGGPEFLAFLHRRCLRLNGRRLTENYISLLLPKNCDESVTQVKQGGYFAK